MMRIVFYMVAIAVLWFCLSVKADSYETYADLTVWIERENELGFRDTVVIEHVVSKTTYDTGEIRLRVAHGTGSTQWCKYPKSVIIKEEDK